MKRSILVPRLLYRKNGEEPGYDTMVEESGYEATVEESGYKTTVEESGYEAKKECVRIWIKMTISE